MAIYSPRPPARGSFSRVGGHRTGKVPKAYGRLRKGYGRYIIERAPCCTAFALLCHGFAGVGQIARQPHQAKSSKSRIIRQQPFFAQSLSLEVWCLVLGIFFGIWDLELVSVTPR